MLALFASFGGVLQLLFPSSQMLLTLCLLSPYMLCFPLRLSNVPALAVGLVMYFTLSLE